MKDNTELKPCPSGKVMEAWNRRPEREGEMINKCKTQEQTGSVRQ